MMVLDPRLFFRRVGDIAAAVAAVFAADTNVEGDGIDLERFRRIGIGIEEEEESVMVICLFVCLFVGTD